MKKFLKKYRNDLTCYALLAIPFALFFLFFLYGFFRGFYISLTDFDMRYVSSRGINFVWFANYKEIFSNANFINGLKHTFIWTVVMLIGNNFFGLLMAALIVRVKRGGKAFLALLYWPSLVSAAIGSQITLFLFNPTETGPLNIIIGKLFNLPPQDWFINEKTALPSLMFLPFFTGFCMKMMIYYAGLRSIPSTYYEAASLETDSRAILFFRITLPLLSPVLFLNILLSVMDGIKIIAPMQLNTPGNDYTISAVYALYIEAFTRTNFSQSFAMGFVLFVIIMILTLIQNRLKGEAIVYE